MVAQSCQFYAGSCGFFTGRRCLLGYVTDIDDAAIDLFRGRALFFGGGRNLLIHRLDRRDGFGNVLQRSTGPTGQFYAAGTKLAAAVHDGCGLLGTALQADNQCFDLFGGFLRALRQAAHFIGNHRKAPTGLTGACGLDSGVEGQQVGLFGDRFDNVQHAADLVALLFQRAHGFARITHSRGEAFDLRNGLVDHPFAITGLTVRRHCSFRGFLGVARDLLNGRRHFMHGRGDLIGLYLLAVDPGTGLLGNRRQLFSRAGNLGDAIANSANQFAQADRHALNPGLQLAQLVLAINVQVTAQVARGHPLYDLEGLLQRGGDLASDDPRRQNAQHQCQRSSSSDHRDRLGAVCVAALVLSGNQVVAGGEHAGAQRSHFFQCGL